VEAPAVVAPETGVSAATDTGTDLSWVTFSSEEGERCGATTVDCPAEAVAAAFWKQTCRCDPDRQPLCVEHRDATARDAAETGPLFECARCGFPVRLLRIEPLR
jgi:hypothetical protein